MIGNHRNKTTES